MAAQPSFRASGKSLVPLTKVVDWCHEKGKADKANE